MADAPLRALGLAGALLLAAACATSSDPDKAPIALTDEDIYGKDAPPSEASTQTRLADLAGEWALMPELSDDPLTLMEGRAGPRAGQPRIRGAGGLGVRGPIGRQGMGMGPGGMGAPRGSPVPGGLNAGSGPVGIGLTNQDPRTEEGPDLEQLIKQSVLGARTLFVSTTGLDPRISADVDLRIGKTSFTGGQLIVERPFESASVLERYATSPDGSELHVAVILRRDAPPGVRPAEGDVSDRRLIRSFTKVQRPTR